MNVPLLKGGLRYMGSHSKNYFRIGFSIFIIASFMLCFNNQAFNGINGSTNNNISIEKVQTSKATNSLSIEQQQSIATLHKMPNQNQPVTINIFSNLIRKSSNRSLKITEINNQQHIPTIRPADLVFTNFHQYLLNFTYQNVYFTKSQSTNNGLVNSQLEPNVSITAYAFFPILLNVYANSSVESGSWNTVITQVQTDAYDASIGLTISFGLQYKFWANILGVQATAGPSSFVTNYNKHYDFKTPFNGQFLGNKLSFTVPTTIPFLSSVGIGVQPKIDVNLASLVQPGNPDISYTRSNLLWQNSNSVQSFSFYTPFFYNQTTAPVKLFNFNMDFSLNLDFFLEINIGVPLLSSFPINLDIFSLPLASVQLPLSGSITNDPTVTASTLQPYVYGVNYAYTVQNDNVIKPGDTVNVSLEVTNLGQGPASSINVYGNSSAVVPIHGKDFIPLLQEQQKSMITLNNFYFTVPSTFSANAFYADIIFTFWSANNTYLYTDYVMYFKVVHPTPTDLYLQVSNVIFNTPGGNLWKAGDSMNLAFNVTNRGNDAITSSNITLFGATDTDSINPVTYSVGQTNISTTSLAVNNSIVLGGITFSSTSSHDNGIVYMTFIVYYQNATVFYQDLYLLAVPITALQPAFSLVSAYGFDHNHNTNGLFMAGDTVDLQFTLQNTGTGKGTSILADLYSYTPDLNFTTSHLNFGSMNSGTIKLGTNGTVILSPSAKNQTAIFSITIYAYDPLGNLITQSFNMSIAITALPPPKIQLLGYSMIDANNGSSVTTPTPGETVIVYVIVNESGRGVGIIGNMSTADNLKITENSASYGALDNQKSTGSGFVVTIPLNFNGSTAYLDVTVTAQSLSGTMVTANGYIMLKGIPVGDITAPNITVNSLAPTSVNTSAQAEVSVTSSDPYVKGDLQSGLSGVYVAYSFDNGAFTIAKMNEQSSTYSYSFDTSNAGSYRYLVFSYDKAGNLAYVANGNNYYTITVKASSTSTNSSSKAKGTPGFESLSVLIAIVTLVGVYKYKKRRN